MSVVSEPHAKDDSMPPRIGPSANNESTQATQPIASGAGYSFEFMDQGWLPHPLRTTLREILECVSSPPFRPYYRWVADEVLRELRSGDYERVVELGAGTARISGLLAESLRGTPLQVIPCDSNPDERAYRAWEARYPQTIRPRYDAVDFSRATHFGPKTLVFLSAAFHHVPPKARAEVIASLTACADRVLVFEPFRRRWSSRLFALCAIPPAFLLPLLTLGRAGWSRRACWCWLIPLAPFLFCWDGLVSCLRQWTESEWQFALERVVGDERPATISSTRFCLKVQW